jgi:plastocyanin
VKRVKRIRLVLISSSMVGTGAAFLIACATGSTASPTSGAAGEGGILETDAGGGTTDATSSPTDAGADSAPIVCSGDSGPDLDGATGLNDCPLVVDGGPAIWYDRTCATETTLQWNLTVTPYDTNRCMKIKAGSSVTWVANPSFNTHPIEPLGGDEPSPFDALDAGGSKSLRVTFPEAGVFGYHCHNHPTAMEGVIQVLP